MRPHLPVGAITEVVTQHSGGNSPQGFWADIIYVFPVTNLFVAGEAESDKGVQALTLFNRVCWNRDAVNGPGHLGEPQRRAPVVICHPGALLKCLLGPDRVNITGCQHSYDSYSAHQALTSVCLFSKAPTESQLPAHFS